MATIQIRDVPPDIHRILKARAAAAGMSLSEYLLREVAAAARRPTTADLIERIRARGSVEPSVDAAEAVRTEREARR
jgi:antitoxin FitA